MSTNASNTIDFDAARLKLRQGAATAVRRAQDIAAPVTFGEAQQNLARHLHTSLELERVLDMFYQELVRFIAVDGLGYRHDVQDIQLQYGAPAMHRCNYRITHAGDYLGEIQFSRQERFAEDQLASVETLMGELLYPLRNALLYREAVLRAMNDALTNTGNRLALNQALEREVKLSIRQRSPLSMLVIDIDRFKTINDRYGHTYGDEALKAMVDCTRLCLRETDGFFRLGGEEFVVLLRDTDENLAMQIAERIRAAVQQMQFEIDGDAVEMTVSLGVATRLHDECAQKLLSSCDQLMYEAKKDGRNRVTGR